MRGLSRREICVSTIDWASLIVGSKFTVFTGLGGLYLEGLIFGGAYFQNFTVFEQQKDTLFQIFEQKRDCLQSSLYFTNSKKTENINILAIMSLSEFLTS